MDTWLLQAATVDVLEPHRMPKTCVHSNNLVHSCSDWLYGCMKLKQRWTPAARGSTPAAAATAILHNIEAEGDCCCTISNVCCCYTAPQLLLPWLHGVEADGRAAVALVLTPAAAAAPAASPGKCSTTELLARGRILYLTTANA